MTVSVVIPLFGRWSLTKQCVEALNAAGGTFELVLVDNGSTDATKDQRVQVRNLTNRGFAVACNQGALYASGDVVVFLNNDTIPQPGWLDALVAPLADPAVGVTGARLTYADGTIQHSGVSVNLTCQPGGEAHNLHDDSPSGDRDAVTGACLAMRRDDFLRLGGFDTAYWNGYEDVDLCLSVLGAGMAVRYVAESTVIHLESQSGAERWTGYTANVARLRAKWGAA
jgi:GT2 family glycosyltransferase